MSPAGFDYKEEKEHSTKNIISGEGKRGREERRSSSNYIITNNVHVNLKGYAAAFCWGSLAQ
jgi:hypothetical protein